MEPAESVLQTSLQNANPIIHPAVTLSNAARIELTGGDFLFYEEGVSDSVGRLIEALDKERIAIGKELGVSILPDPEMGMRQGYMLEANYGSGYRKAPGFLGIGAQPAARSSLSQRRCRLRAGIHVEARPADRCCDAWYGRNY